jgi:hypothetical protein
MTRLIFVLFHFFKFPNNINPPPHSSKGNLFTITFYNVYYCTKVILPVADGSVLLAPEVLDVSIVVDPPGIVVVGHIIQESIL